MLDDIVPLPNRLRDIKGKEATISSMQCVWYPVPTLYRNVGYYEPDDSNVTCIGSEVVVPTGKYAWFRYKFIERLPGQICEFLVMTETPLDIMKPLQSQGVKLYCPCFSVTDRSLSRKTYAIWKNVRILAELEHPNDSLAVECAIGDEGKLFAEIYNSPEVAKAVDTYPNDDTAVSEIKDRGADDQLLFRQLISNIDAFRARLEEHGPYSWFDPALILCGLRLPKRWSNITGLERSTLLNMFLRGPISLKELVPYISPAYITHPFKRNIIDELMDPHTEVSIEGENSELYQILKYAGHLPYSEVGIEIVRNLVDNKLVGEASVYNPYDLYMPVPKSQLKHQQRLESTVSSICDFIQTAYPNCQQAQLLRSWNEEVYITIRNADGSTERFYFDLVSEILVTQALLREYTGPAHALGMT